MGVFMKQCVVLSGRQKRAIIIDLNSNEDQGFTKNIVRGPEVTHQGVPAHPRRLRCALPRHSPRPEKIHDPTRKSPPIQQAIADEETSTLEVELEDLEGFFRKEEEHLMVEGFRKNTSRYIDMFNQVAEEIMPKREKPIDPDEVPPPPLRNSGTNSRIF